MKSNEAPEKLYISSKQRPDKEIFYGTCTKVEDNDIEYIRKNAFIEKMETWLNKRHKYDRYTLIYFRKHFKNIINEIMKD